MKDLLDQPYRLISLEILRLMLCFSVVVGHFCKQSHNILCKPFHYLSGLAVPIFMIMFFYFFQEKVSTFDWNKLGLRLKRLLIPLFGWGVIGFIIILFIGTDISVYDLLYQLLLGHSPKINTPLWYLFDLVALTILFYCFFTLPKHKELMGEYIIAIALIAYFFQYSNINYSFFAEMKSELKFPLGRLCEMIPFACIGYLISFYKLPEKNNFLSILSFSTFIIIILKLYFKPIIVPSGFYYSGITFSILSSWIFVLFLKIEKIINLKNSNNSLSWINRFTKYTLGIYCCNYIVFKIIYSFFEKQLSFAYCIVLYCICYLVCFFISFIPVKFFKYLIQ